MKEPHFQATLEFYSQRITPILAKYTTELTPSTLINAMQYSLFAGGKRVRPFLVYTVGKMFGLSLEKLDPLAAAIEMIHTYSLIHDDLPAMDNDSLRRGKPTCHIQYDEATAILAGDALQSLAFQVLAADLNYSPETKIMMITELASASGASGMCVGQLFDIESEHKKINFEQLKTIHHYKTGVLIRASVRLAVYAAGKKALNYLPVLDEYAQSIGLAFQIQDDILDVIGNQEKMGKQQGTDQQLEKNTYSSMLGLEAAQHEAKRTYEKAIVALEQLPLDSVDLKALAYFIIHRDY